MNAIFLSGFLHVFEALLRIFFIILLAGLLVRKNIITSTQVDALSKITVIVLLPSLVLSNTLLHFTPRNLSYWWLLPVLGISMSLWGLLLASGIFFNNYSSKKDMLALASMQNAGYLVLPVAQVVYPERFNEFAILTFLFILGYNPLLWTIGKQLITNTYHHDKPRRLEQIITPPAAANIFSLLLVLSGLQHIFPETLVQSFDFLGKAAVPVATFVLGATLGSISLKKLNSMIDITKVLLVKYLLLPLSIVAILSYLHLEKKYPLLSDFLIIQASAAPATGLILQVSAYGGNRQKVAETMLVSYLICLIAMPFWLAWWHSINI